MHFFCFISSAASCTIKFTFNQKYPDEAPDIEITDSDNLSDKYLGILEEHMKEVVSWLTRTLVALEISSKMCLYRSP